MIAILEKTEHNTDFHQIVDFLEASHIRYALTISLTIYVSYIRQFWSTARIETTDQETKIIAIVDGKPRTISESSLRRSLKLNDEEGISSLPNAELFENLSLMGYNIFPSQSNIATAIVCLATNRVYNFSKMIFDDLMRNINTPTETLTPRRLTKRAIRIAQSKALSPDTDEHASLSRDDRHREAFPTVSSLDAGQDRENTAKTSAMSHESSPRVPSLDADEGSMQQRLHELMELCTSLQRKQSQMPNKIKDQDIEISGLKARVKSLDDKERRREEPVQEDAPITGGIIDIGEELGAYKSTDKGSNDTEEMVNMLSSIEAANILSIGGATFSTASVSLADVFPTAGVPTVSGSFLTVSVIFTTASVATPYTRRSRGITIGSLQHMRIPIISAKDKGKEKVTKTELPKKKKLQKQIDARVAREMEEEFARKIKGLDRSNEVIAKHLSKYEQAEADLSVGEKIELITPTKTLTPRRLTKRVIRIAQSKALSPDTDEHASLSRDDRHGEAFPTVSSLDVGQDRENIAKTSAMSYESSPRVPSLDADEGSMQQRLHELMELCTSLQRKQSQIPNKIKDQDIEISRLKARVKSLDDKERRREEPIQKDAPITRGIIDIGEELGAYKSTEKGSNDTEEMVNMLSSIEAVNILSIRGATFSTASVSLADVFLTAGVPTVIGSFPTVSAIFTTASVATPYIRRSRGPAEQTIIKEGAKEVLHVCSKKPC
nr:hypothetical protein [Tanacetum cinerariifolium]